MILWQAQPGKLWGVSQQFFKEVQDNEEDRRKLKAEADIVRSGDVAVEAGRVSVRRDLYAATQRCFQHLETRSAIPFGCTLMRRTHKRQSGEHVAARREGADFHGERARQIVDPAQRLQAQELSGCSGTVAADYVHVAAET